jgi:transposase-like protein
MQDEQDGTSRSTMSWVEHLGYEHHQPYNNGNSRNSYSSKILITEDGAYAVDDPRDRDGNFEPQIVRKHQTRLTKMANIIHCLYAKCMTTREIATEDEALMALEAFSAYLDERYPQISSNWRTC